MENKIIRILQIVPNMQSGGLENFIMNVYRNIDRNQVQFDFLVHYKEKKQYDNEIEALGGKIYRFDLRNNNNIIKYIIDLNKFYKEHKEYKVIHCHMSSIGFINFAIAKLNGINIRIAHSHNSSTDKTIKGRIKYLLMLPYKYISTVNFACSEKAGKYLFGNKKFRIIPNAIDISKFKYNPDQRRLYRKKLNIQDDKFVIGHIGRFNIQKNHQFIIDVFYEYQKKNENAVLLLIGEGELFEEIQQKCNDKKIMDKIIFLGIVDNPYNYYNVMDLFILPSFFEGLPVVGIEAQTNGLKCLFSNNITREVELIDSTQFLELKNELWVNTIEMEEKQGKYDRTKNNDLIENSDFEISKVSKEILKIYLRLYNKGRKK